MPVSVMAAALREAGVKTSAEELEEVYRGAVRQHPGNEVAARNVVVQAVERDLTLLHGLVQAYFDYQRQRGTRHINGESQKSADRPAPSPPPNGRDTVGESQEGHDPVDAAASSTSTAKAQNAGGRQKASESQSAFDPAGQRDGRRPTRAASHGARDSAPVAPATKLSKAGMRNVARQAGGYGFILMTAGGSNGPVAMGDVPVDAWKNQIFTAGREKLIGRAVDKYLRRQAHVPPNAKTADIVPEALCKKMQSYATYASQHGIEYLSDDQLLDDIEAYDG